MIYKVFKNNKFVGEFIFASDAKALEYLQILKEESYSTWIAKRVKK